jgi:hypothetical protein
MTLAASGTVVEPVSAVEPVSRRARWLAPDSPAPVYAGVALVAIGAALIGYTWVQVARLTSVPLQLPYLASSGLTGLGLVIVGALVLSIAAKRRDAAERSRQLEELALILGAMSKTRER